MAVERLLLETGDLLLLETGDALLLESSSGGSAYTLACDAGSFTISGQDATLVYTPGATPTAYTLACEAGAFVISGQAANLVWSGANRQTDTHDGFWSREWAKLKKREEKKPTIAEVVEIVKESPQVLEVVRAEVVRKYPQVDYAAVRENLQLQRFIAKQLIEAAEEEDDIETMLLMA
jgi:hypothetical protein